MKPSKVNRVDAYFVVIAVAGSCVFWHMARRVGAWRWQEFAVLLPLYTLLGQLRVRLPSGIHITPIYPFAAATLVVLGPAHAVGLAMASYFVRMVVNRERLLRTLFICGQLCMTAELASRAFMLAGGVPGRLDVPRDLPAFLALGLCYDAVNIAFVQGRLSVAEGSEFFRNWWRALLYSRGCAMPIYHILGLVCALLFVDRGVWGLVVGILPLFGLHAFFKLHVEAADVRQAALTDKLTGVGNYRALMDWMNFSFHGLASAGRQVSLLSMDVDDLKVINDTYGHEAGNEALKAVAATLLGNTRHTDVVARYGGDEFVVILVGAAPPEAEAVRERILSALADLRIEHNGSQLSVGLSIGLANHPRDAAAASELLAAADRAMYQVKLERKGTARRSAPSTAAD
jgi:diguanylate cyclase (GGDEF)-like protein